MEFNSDKIFRARDPYFFIGTFAGGSTMVPGGRERFCKVIPGSSLIVLIVTGLLLMIAVDIVSFPFNVFIMFVLVI